MEEDYQVSPIVPIGDKRYFSVEYPGYVKNVDRALASLGGEKELAEALNRETNVKLRYRPNDPFSHPIQGRILPTAKLLVKVTRRVKRDRTTGEIIEDASEKYQTVVEGIVTKTVRFRALADFQYIVPKDNTISQLKHSLMQGDIQSIIDYKFRPDIEGDQHRQIPPPVFTSADGPLNYGYRQNSPILRVRVRKPDGSFEIKLLNRALQSGFAVTGIRFHEENVPTKSWHILPPLKKPGELKTLEIVRGLYREFPVWTRYTVKSRLDPELHQFIKCALTRIGYVFIDGPWRDCWFPYGKDPRLDPECFKYQQVDVRRYNSAENRKDKLSLLTRKQAPASERKKATKVEPVPENDQIFDGINVPGNSSVYMLCNVTDPELTGMIYNPKYRKAEVTRIGGYYYECVIQRIRHILKAKYAALADTGVAVPSPDSEEGLMEEIEKEIEKEIKKKAEGVDDNDENEENEENRDLNVKEATDAVQKATEAIDSPERSKRLKDVVEDYMANLADKNEFEEISDGEIDVDELEEYDEEEYRLANEAAEENEQEEEEEGNKPDQEKEKPNEEEDVFNQEGVKIKTEDIDMDKKV